MHMIWLYIFMGYHCYQIVISVQIFLNKSVSIRVHSGEKCSICNYSQMLKLVFFKIMSEESTAKRKHDIILEIVFISIPGPPGRQQYNEIGQYLQSLRWLYFQKSRNKPGGLNCLVLPKKLIKNLLPLTLSQNCPTFLAGLSFSAFCSLYQKLIIKISPDGKTYKTPHLRNQVFRLEDGKVFNLGTVELGICALCLGMTVKSDQNCCQEFFWSSPRHCSDSNPPFYNVFDKMV